MNEPPQKLRMPEFATVEAGARICLTVCCVSSGSWAIASTIRVLFIL
ncbi:MAG: hypothetical protein HC769_20080 [Cyanobacteria bacterium CRU_2_1]|nr:hypothetical protein [Cyanobacteria bacterium CRU_2_1]